MIFTFHYGEIKAGREYFLGWQSMIKFTFHYGEIKSEVINIVIGKPGSFTFHCGEIKVVWGTTYRYIYP